jgi:hypothetical protein
VSNRPLLASHPILTSQSLATSFTSPATVIQQVSMVSYAMDWTGSSPIGVISLQVSNDYRPATGGQPGVAGNWNDLPLSQTCNLTGSTGTGFIDIDQCGAYAIRLKYVASSGTGSLNCQISGKAA